MSDQMCRCIFISLLSVLGAAPFSAFAQAKDSGCMVKVTEPRAGQQLGAVFTVKGTAVIPDGHHLWVFARRVDFEPFWTPQAEGRINSETGSWKVSAHFGTANDISWDFDVAIAVFSEKEHLVLRDYRNRAMKSGHWTEIEMPKAACTPTLLTVIKTSH